MDRRRAQGFGLSLLFLLCKLSFSDLIWGFAPNWRLKKSGGMDGTRNPKSSDAQSHSGKGIPPLSPEALTQILTQIFG